MASHSNPFAAGEHPTVMWEVAASADQVGELLEWVMSHAPEEAQVYRSVDDKARVVVIDPTGRADVVLAQVPSHMVLRAAHAWKFQPQRKL